LIYEELYIKILKLISSEINNRDEMNGWVIFLIFLPFFLAIIIFVIFRIYYRTHSKEKEKEIKLKKPIVNADEIKRRETFRERIRNFLQRY
jgi:hypothetical protein